MHLVAISIVGVDSEVWRNTVHLTTFVVSSKHSWNIGSEFLKTSLMISVPSCCQISCTRLLLTRWQNCWLNRIFLFICMSWTQQLRHLSCLYGGKFHMTQSIICWAVLHLWILVSVHSEQQNFCYARSWDTTGCESVERGKLLYVMYISPASQYL